MDHASVAHWGAIGHPERTAARVMVDWMGRSDELRTKICRIPGVRNARVEIESGSISRIRILTNEGEQTSPIVKRVTDMVSNEFDAIVDPSVIEFIRESGTPGGGVSRPNLAALTINRSAETFTVQVILDRDRRDFVAGDADSAVTPPQERRAVASAVVGAMRKALAEHLTVESVEVLESGGDRIMIVRLMLGSTNLVGSAIVRRDDHDAVARATLCALNRFVDQPTSMV